MNKIKLLSIFTFLFTAFSFVSCDNEPVDPTLLQQVNNNSNGNNGNGNNSTTAVFKADFAFRNR